MRVSKRLLRRLLDAGHAAEHGALVVGAGLEVERLLAGGRERVQHARLRAAGRAAQHVQRQPRRDAVDRRDDVLAVLLVAAAELTRVPADEAQPLHHRAAAQPAAPAVHDRSPAPRAGRPSTSRGGGRGWLRRIRRRRDAPRTRPAACRACRRCVARRRSAPAVDGAGHVVDREFGRRPRVDDRLAVVEIVDARVRLRRGAARHRPTALERSCVTHASGTTGPTRRSRAATRSS